MNLLLLLSALLSALTGLSSAGQPAPVAAEQVAQRAANVLAQTTAPRQAGGPVQVFDVIAARRAVAPLVRLPRFDLPAYASRRRE